ncbi:hypothetical protein CWD77_11915 [Rhodohalobacter barkolensis]|uniref:Uncharacterized protein n=1 Tax=Rhodohalobacter barkolensis TaxID=2053187 RepID=A0A2N0VGJ0_9BACT|nr:hypothetical protein CWD77_11915 [Rhodohalobacter barkolensis]
MRDEWWWLRHGIYIRSTLLVFGLQYYVKIAPLLAAFFCGGGAGGWVAPTGLFIILSLRYPPLKWWAKM